MNIFKRILKIGQAEIHALVEKMESPIALIQQGIDDIKIQLSELNELLITNKAFIIKNDNTIRSKKHEAEEYEQKALLILQKAKNGDIDNRRAEELALQALQLKKNLAEEIQILEEDNRNHSENNSTLNGKIDIVKFNLAKWEKELQTLKAKQRINNATTFANNQMKHIEHNSTIALLEQMKSKLDFEEAYNESFNIHLENQQRDFDLSKTVDDKDDLGFQLSKLKDLINKL